jgi:hypothetical protein
MPLPAPPPSHVRKDGRHSGDAYASVLWENMNIYRCWRWGVLLVMTSACWFREGCEIGGDCCEGGECARGQDVEVGESGALCYPAWSVCVVVGRDGRGGKTYDSTSPDSMVASPGSTLVTTWYLWRQYTVKGTSRIVILRTKQMTHQFSIWQHQ